MSTARASDRFTSLPDDQALAATVVALEEHGFSVEVVDDSDAARAAVLARIPQELPGRIRIVLIRQPVGF
jgi:hypothetical protein